MYLPVQEEALTCRRTEDDSRPGGYDPSLDETKNRKGIFNMYLLGDKLAMQGMIDVVPIPFSNTPIGERGLLQLHPVSG